MPLLSGALICQVFFLVLSHDLSHFIRGVLEVDSVDFDRVEIEAIDEYCELLNAYSLVSMTLI